MCPNGSRFRDIQSVNMPVIENELMINTKTSVIGGNNTTSEEAIKWTEWSGCSASCGVGQQIRTVICVNTNNCDQNKREVRDCLVRLCNKGNWYLILC